MPPDLCLYLRGLLLRGWRETGGGRKGKGEGRGEVEGGIWPTQKFWCGAPYATDDAKFVTEILGGTKIRTLGDKVYLFVLRENKPIKLIKQWNNL